MRFFIFLLLPLCSFASLVPQSDPEPIALFTIAKSGSHLIMKTIHLMTEFREKWHTVPSHIGVIHSQRRFLWTHFCLSNELLDFYSRQTDLKKIVGIRDLRDVAVSAVHQIIKRGWPDEFSEDEEKLQKFKDLSFDEQLLYVINQDYELSNWKINVQLSLPKAAPQAVQFCSDPSVLVCRYEDLVGPKGGGTRDAQLKTIEKIAKHIGVPLLDESAQRIADVIYGDSYGYNRTFREGETGGWRKVFKEEHKQAFKARLGASLIALGYEKDDNW